MQGAISREDAAPEIEAACQRALVAAAQEAGAATRQQRRAAARRFVRRHRRDSSYLAWVLRSVAASSALAVTLLGFGAEPARAGAAGFIELTGAANPLDGESVGYQAAPALGDLDGDGDLDLVAGDYAGGFFYYENTGSATSPAFVERIGSANPLDLKNVGGGGYSAPTLGDMDGDGDLDLVGGEALGAFRYYENTGSATSPAFVQRTGAANPLDGEDVGELATPALGDPDGDGDLDLFAGEQLGTFLYYENTGSALSPAFALRTGTANPLDGEDVGSRSHPTVGDLDGDGDPDLVAGVADGTFRTFENTRSPATLGRLPFDPHTGAANPLDGESMGSASSTPALGDLDADGDPDLVSGAADGSFGYFENTGNAGTPVFVARTGTSNPLDGAAVTTSASAPALGDLDGDGDLDLVAGEALGTFVYFENTGSATSPAFVERTGVANPLFGELVGSNSTPTLGDLDGDGDLDLLAGRSNGTFLYYENTGSATSPAFVERTGAANPLDGENAGGFSAPALGDVDGDGDLDLLAGEQLGSFFYYQNTGSAPSPAFALRTGRDNPLDGEGAGSSSTPALGDLDGDGDLDLVAGGSFGGFLYFENPNERAAEFRERTGVKNPLSNEDVGDGAAPALGDLDGDGDLDLIVGELYGTFFYYENTGSAATPALIERTGTANPLDGLSVELHLSVPTLGDVDGDGDLDLVAGEFYGRFQYYENTGSATSPVFVERTGTANPLDGLGVGFGGYTTAPALGDLDGDGDLDLVAGANFSTFFYYENTGSATSPAFVERTGATNPLDGENPGGQAAPALGDLDGDGDLDLVSGVRGYYENTGSATSPAFVERTGAADPLDGENSGTQSRIALGDLDADGDLDLVAGDAAGTFRTWYLPEPGQGWMLAAGLALLKLLERLRRPGRH